MGGYISVLYKNYNTPVYNENQYACRSIHLLTERFVYI